MILKISKKIVTNILILFFIICQQVYSQSLVEQLINYQDQKYKNYPEENIFINTDKETYLVGDALWFTAHVFSNNQIKSKILYAELIFGKDSLISKINLKVDQNLATNFFLLPDNLPQGLYRIRVYSSWMSNFPEKNWGNKSFKIWNKQQRNLQFKVNYDSKKDSIIAKINIKDLGNNPILDAKINVKFNNNSFQKTLYTDKLGNIYVFISKKLIENKDFMILSCYYQNKINVEKIPFYESWPWVDANFNIEGGNLIANIPAKISTRISNPFGIGVEAKGFVINSKNEKILEFKTEKMGMTQFKFLPITEEIYKAVVVLADQSQLVIKIGEVKNEGYHLKVNNLDPDTIFAKVEISKQLNQLLIQNKKKISLLVLQNNQIKYAVRKKIINNTINFIIDKKLFNSGLATLILMAENPDENVKIDSLIDRSIILCQRNVFINTSILKKQKLNQNHKTLLANNQSYLKINDNDFKTNTAFKISQLPEERDYISQYYLKTNLSRFEDINLMNLDSIELNKIVDLYCNNFHIDYFEIDKILKNEMPNIQNPIEIGQTISGKVRSVFSRPASNSKLILLSKSNQISPQTKISNEKGEFVFDNFEFYDSATFILQAQKDNKSNKVVIDLDPELSPLFTQNISFYNYYSTVNASCWSSTLDQNISKIPSWVNKKSILLDEVDIFAKKNEYKETNLNLHSNADFVIQGKDLNASTGNILDAIYGRVPGMQIIPDPTQPGGYVIRLRGVNSFNGSVNPLVIVDGRQYNDITVLESIRPTDVKSVEILKNVENTAIYGGNGSNGVIVVNTKRGLGVEAEIPEGIITFSKLGFKTNIPFYQIKSSINNPTLLWETNSIFKENLASYNFKTQDMGLYKCTMLGVNKNGELIQKTADIIVK